MLKTNSDRIFFYLRPVISALDPHLYPQISKVFPLRLVFVKVVKPTRPCYLFLSDALLAFEVFASQAIC